MDIVDDIIDLFFKYGRVHLLGNGEYEVFVDNEHELRKQIEKIIAEK